MTQAQDTRDITAGMRHVQPESIEKSLDDMWREANASALASGHHAGSRNSVMTLVVYTHDSQQAARVMDIVDQLKSVHPSRAIIVISQPQTIATPIESYIATHMDEVGGSMTYGEEILLRATDAAARHLPGAVLPLIVSGLPSYLWWIGEPTWGSEQLEALVDGSDRMIVDTSEVAHPETSLVALDDLIHRKATSCTISDFAWTRSGPWRELVAQFFDGADRRQYLAGIDRVTVEYAAGREDGPVNPAQSYLFAGWLASLLHWQLHGRASAGSGDAERQHTLYDPTGRAIMIELTPRYGVNLKSWMDITPQRAPISGTLQAAEMCVDNETCIGPGALMLVHIHARGASSVGTFTVARERDLEHASTLCQVPENAPPSQTVHLPSLGEAMVLMEQLNVGGHDAVYEDALALAAQLLGPRTRRG